MGLPLSVSKTLAAASANNIALSQTPLSAGNLTINGSLATAGVATLDTQRQVLLTFAADETGHNFTVYGTNQSATPISEAVAGTATTAVTTLDYKTVTRIAISAASTGAITVGTNGVGATPWIAANTLISPVNITLAVTVSGTVNYTVQSTYDIDPCGITSNAALTTPIAFNHPVLTGQTANNDGALSSPVSAYRLLINSGTGTATLHAIEAGVRGN